MFCCLLLGTRENKGKEEKEIQTSNNRYDIIVCMFCVHVQVYIQVYVCDGLNVVLTWISMMRSKGSKK